MAQERTTNLDLVLPIQADDVLVQDINGNMTKIDTFAGQTNQALSNLDSAVNVTNDILTDAISCTKTSVFRGTGGNYTGTVPAIQYKYGAFIVNIWGGIRLIIAQASNGDVAVNAYDGTKWLGWQMLALKDEETITLTAGSNFTLYGYKALRVDKVIHCTGYLTTKGAISKNDIVLSFPSGIKASVFTTFTRNFGDKEFTVSSNNANDIIVDQAPATATGANEYYMYNFCAIMN